MDILDRFLENAKKSIAEGYYDIEKADGIEKISLRKKLDERFTVITEIKHASPSGDYGYREIDPERTAMDFLESGADAISAVVEPKLFRGKLSNIPLAKKAGLPVLFKDFVISEKQIEAAGNVGADVVLLVVKALSRMEIDVESMIRKAHDAGLEVLLESYDEDEMALAMDSGADILGINNRDLQTLEVDIGRTKRILEETGTADKPVISESGIKSAEDVRFVRNLGVSGVLVGTAIWKAENLKEKVRELRGGADE